MNDHFRPSPTLSGIYLYHQPVDFRKGFRGLAVLVEQELGHNPFKKNSNGRVKAMRSSRLPVNKLIGCLTVTVYLMKPHKILHYEWVFLAGFLYDSGIVKPCDNITKPDGSDMLSVEELQDVISQKDQKIKSQAALIKLQDEKLRLATLKRFAASSEKIPFEIDFFDEAELEVALDDLDRTLKSSCFFRSVFGEKNLPNSRGFFNLFCKCFLVHQVVTYSWMGTN